MLDGPIARGDFCVLEFAGIFFEVSWKTGGRITSAKLGDRELLASASVHPSNYGSTFWTAPQSDWHWPPVAEIDHAPYAASSEGAAFTLVGPAVSSVAGVVADLSVTKRFSADFVKKAIVCEYTLVNTSAVAKTVAPWEITRVGRGGLTFYASDSAPMQAGHRPLLPTLRADGVYWFEHDENTPVEGKLNADGKGWVAHLTPERLLLIKTFPDIQQAEAAQGEGEVEIYANLKASAPNAYVEVENQGAYRAIPAGGSLSWSVRWYLRTLPDNIDARAVSRDLVAFATEAIK